MPEFDELILNLDKKDEKLLKETLEQLGDLGDPRAVSHLLKMLDTVSEEEILESVLWTLSRIASYEILIDLLTHSNEKIVVEVLDALGRRQERGAVDEIIPFVKHQNAEYRAMATWALGKIQMEKTYDLLLNSLKTDKDSSVRANAAWALGKFGKLESIALLSQILEQEKDEVVRYNIEESINRLQELKDPRRDSLKATVYECPNHEINCIQKNTRIESQSDNFIRMEIVVCDNCPLAKICQIHLIRKINQ